MLERLRYISMIGPLVGAKKTKVHIGMELGNG